VVVYIHRDSCGRILTSYRYSSVPVPGTDMIRILVVAPGTGSQFYTAMYFTVVPGTPRTTYQVPGTVPVRSTWIVWKQALDISENLYCQDGELV
jgi:hypothetical protein